MSSTLRLSMLLYISASGKHEKSTIIISCTSIYKCRIGVQQKYGSVRYRGVLHIKNNTTNIHLSCTPKTKKLKISIAKILIQQIQFKIIHQIISHGKIHFVNDTSSIWGFQYIFIAWSQATWIQTTF